MFDGGHNPVTGTPVPFNVIFNPYRLVGAGFSKQQLETFAYDEEEDGEDWGADADSGRDDWTAYHRWETHVRAYQLHAFARRENAAPGGTGFETSVFDLALAAADGSTNEFDAALRLFRLMNQRIIWTSGWVGNDVDEMLGDNYTHTPSDSDPSHISLTPSDARTFSRNNNDLYGAFAQKRIRGQCMDFAAGLVGLARSLGIPARHAATNAAFSWGGFHAWSEVYLPASLLPKQGGMTTVGGSTPSDHDSWYVFDSTDNYDVDDASTPLDESWRHSEEAIDPRVDFYSSFVNNGATVPSEIYVSRLDWCYTGSCPAQGERVLAGYSTPTDFWMAGTPGSSVPGDARGTRVATAAQGSHLHVVMWDFGPESLLRQVRYVRGSRGCRGWSAPIALVPAAAAATDLQDVGEPHPAIAASGNLVAIVWSDIPAVANPAQRNVLFVRSSLDGGATWQPAVKLASPEPGRILGAKSVAVDGGRIRVVSTLGYWESARAGRSWSQVRPAWAGESISSVRGLTSVAGSGRHGDHRSVFHFRIP